MGAEASAKGHAWLWKEKTAAFGDACIHPFHYQQKS